MRTSPTLPTDHGRTTIRHDDIAAAMRNTDQWVHVGDYKSRKSAAHIASDIRCGHVKAYRGHLYDARAITTETGEHQVWGRYAGERGPRR